MQDCSSHPVLPRLKRWQIASMTLTGAVVTAILALVFFVPTVDIVARRTAQQLHRDYAELPTQFVQDNRGLLEVLSCADYHYEAIASSAGYSIPMDDVCHAKISWFDFELLKEAVPASQSYSGEYDIESGHRYYRILLQHG